MTIKIGEKIKELRKKADVNQERFAGYLGVTAQAVSKWEVEGCYPDIELLPSIANFFNISIDELMCFDVMKNQEKVDMIIKQVGPERSKNWFDGTIIEMLRNAVQECPNNYELLFCLAKTLCFTKKPEEEKQKNLRESISICTRILGDCTEDSLRFRSLQVLARAYKDILKTNPAYIYDLIRTGKLPALKLGSIRVRKQSLEQFLIDYEGKDLSDINAITDLKDHNRKNTHIE